MPPTSLELHSQILVMGGRGGGNDMGSYFIPKQITTSEFVYLKKIITFFSILKKSLGPLFTSQKNPSVVLQPKKNPGIFYRPKESTLGQNFRFKKITWTTDFPPPPPTHHVINICEWDPGPNLIGTCASFCLPKVLHAFTLLIYIKPQYLP